MAIVSGLARALQANFDKAVAVVACIIIVLAAGPLLLRLTPPKRAPGSLKGFASFGSPKFYKNRAGFLREGKEQTADRQFSFWYGPHHVVALSGTDARAGYLTSRGLDSVAGFQILFGNFLNIDGLTNTLSRTTKLAYKKCTQDDQIMLNLHHLVNDSANFFNQLGLPAIIDPVDKMAAIVYRLTHRMNGTHDIANNLKLVNKTREVYKPLEESSMFDIWFPLVPTPVKFKKFLAYSKLYWMIQGFIKDRRKSGRVENDAMQLIMDQNISDSIIALGIIGAVLPAILNSAITASWNMCFLAQNPAWARKLKAEIDQVLGTHRESHDEKISDTLQRLTLEDWETRFPSLELSLKETIRFVMAGTIVRKNISGKEIPIGNTDKFIPPNSLAVYSAADAHMNPDIYKDPHKWDPERHTEARAEGQNVPHSYLGWGSGNHPCPAMRVAKLTIIVPTIMFLASFDIAMCDTQGKTIHGPLPPLTFDRVGAARPSKKVHMKCEFKIPKGRA